MKIKKILFLLVFLILGIVLFIPNTVSATVGEEFSDGEGFKYKIITEDNNGKNEVEISGYTGVGTDIIIPRTVKNGDITYTIKSIGNNAFMWNSTITTLRFAEDSKLEKIVGGAFYGASALKSVYLPESLITIEGLNAFTECTQLSTVVLPDSLIDLGRSTFYGCTSLKNITIPEKVTKLKQNFQNCTNLETVTIKGSLTSFGHFTFFECKNLTDIIFEKPYTLDYVGNCLFYNCEKLNIKEFHITEGVTTIGNDAFYNCKLLEVVTIPSSVETISARAFEGCSSLEKAYVISEDCSISSYIFRNCSNNLAIYGFKNSTIEQYINDSNVFVEIYKVNNKLTNIINNGLNYAHKDFGDYITYLTPSVGYELPKNIRIKVNEYDLSYDEYEYNSKSGKLKIYANKINGNIEIEAYGEKIIKISFDGNGGIFSENKKIIEYDNINDCDFSSLAIPTRDGYKFIGYFTKNGTSIEDVFNSETGIDRDIIFYARWEKEYTYTFITGDNQKFTLNKIDEYSFKIDGDYNLFRKVVINRLNLEKDVDYKVEEGSTTITFTKTGIAKLNTLEIGTYDVVVEYTNDKSVVGKLIIEEDKTIDDATENIPSGDKTEGEESNVDESDKDNTEKENIITDNKDTSRSTGSNPQTSDNIFIFVIILGIAVMGIIITTKIRKHIKE